MTDRPILFSAPMVRALLAGTKTQTRRLIKPQPFENDYFEGAIDMHEIKADSRGPKAFRFNASAVGGGAVLEEVFEPRISKDDRLWVRESWKPHSLYDHLPPSRMPPSNVFYLADEGYSPSGSRGRPGIHMPRWASRMTLDVTDVRVQRLQDISGFDAIAEGAEITGEQTMTGPMVKIAPGTYLSPVAWYHRLWDEINGNGAWDANPWVVAYTFTVHRQNIDQMAKEAA